jgi:hypothetical protein
LSNLLYTEQWNYTKQEMGINVAIGGGINFFVIAFLTFFADRFNRMRAYQVLICLSLTCQVLYYSYVNFVLPDKHPSLIEIIVFGEVISILSILTGLVYVPLVYDYVRRNKMGTYNAGASVVAKLTTIITLNGVGLFVWGYAMLFQPPAGDMTRIVLRGDQNTQADVLNVLHSATWTYPTDGTPAPTSAISARAWQVNGTVSSTGRCWEVRLRDKASEDLATEKNNLEAQNSPLVANEKMLQDQVAILTREAKTSEATAVKKKAADLENRVAVTNARIDAIDQKLHARADDFHAQVVKALGNRMISDGEQILEASPHLALLLDLPTTHRPDARLLEKVASDLRRTRTDLIDLRPLKRDTGYGLEISAVFPPGTDETAFASALQSVVTPIIDQADHDLLASDAKPLSHSIEPAVTLDLMVVETPVNTYVSPITRVVNAVLALFHDAPDPERRLHAIAQNLRVPGQLDDVFIKAGSAPKTLAVTAVLPSTLPGATVADAVTARLGDLLKGKDAPADFALRVRTLYDRVEKAAATQKITVARPTLASDYASMKYDYMSGYLWMFIMGTIGIGITLVFARAEARGFVRKRGVEEAMES